MSRSWVEQYQQISALAELDQFYGAFKKYDIVRLLGTRFTNAISYFEPRAHEPYRVGNAL
jgi:hypothetical protein